MNIYKMAACSFRRFFECFLHGQMMEKMRKVSDKRLTIHSKKVLGFSLI